MYSFFRSNPKSVASQRRSWQKTVKKMFFEKDKLRSEHQKLVNEAKMKTKNNEK